MGEREKLLQEYSSLVPTNIQDDPKQYTAEFLKVQIPRLTECYRFLAGLPPKNPDVLEQIRSDRQKRQLKRK